jgi:hypothetical protein
MMRPSSKGPARPGWARAIGWQRCLLGGGLLLAPAGLPRLVRSDVPPVWLTRVLGGRLLAQGLISLTRPTGPVLVGGAAVDAMHAVSLMPLAFSLRYRRIALLSALDAATAAALALAAADGAR